jgi:hypothetical protein
MILQIFAVKDRQVDAFLQPFFSPTTGSALRSIMEVLNDPQHTFAKHAADYVLHHLGSFDDAIGVISAFALADPIVNLSDLMKPEIKN